MPNVRSELQQKARSAIFQYAFFRWENAVIIAGAILLTVFWPRPFSWWPIWGWPLLGALGVSALVYSSVTDAETNARVLEALFKKRFDPRQIKDPTLRDDLTRALEYQRSIETLVHQESEGVLRTRLDATADQLGDWVGNVYRLTRRLDAYREDRLLEKERARAPAELETLVARRQREQDPTVHQELNDLIAGKKKYLETLQALDARMKQAELQLEQSLTALATIYRQMQLIGAQDLESGRSERLRADVQEQVERLNDLIASINEVYDYHRHGGGLS